MERPEEKAKARGMEAGSISWRALCLLGCAPYFGGIGFFNKEDSARKGGTVQVRRSERIIRAE